MNSVLSAGASLRGTTSKCVRVDNGSFSSALNVAAPRSHGISMCGRGIYEDFNKYQWWSAEKSIIFFNTDIENFRAHGHTSS